MRAACHDDTDRAHHCRLGFLLRCPSGGTGLGLSISLEDTHLHGGWLQAWGRPGEGAQFRLTLPRQLGTQLRHSPLPLVPVDARETA